MELVWIILAIGFVYYLNKDDSISRSKLLAMGKIIDKEFEKRDTEIEALKNEIKNIKDELGIN